MTPVRWALLNWPAQLLIGDDTKFRSRHDSPLSGGEALGIGLFKFETDPRTREIGTKFTIDRVLNSVEEHVFDTYMIVEIFEVTQGDSRAGNMRMQGRSAVPRELQVVRLAESRSLKKSSKAAAPGAIGLQYIDGT